jgi:hypothetical protein
VNTETAVATYVFGLVVVVLIGLVIRRMLRGWRRRSARQAELIGALPEPPVRLGPAVIAPSPGLYIGSTMAGDWLERVSSPELGHRARATLARYAEGILVERSGAGPIWVPQNSLIGVRTGSALAGKVVAGRPDRLLLIRWRLPTGTEIDTGFRGDDPGAYPRWTGGPR